MAGKWWQKAIVYQIYPKSFQDTNGDGIGDLQGIIRRLDYLQDLGVNMLWLCPINVSPMCDNGYDIEDYYHIDPSFGTDEDFEALIREAGSRQMKVIMDLVVNHCSYRHKWFQDVLRNPASPYASYFIIREGFGGKEPNNLRCYPGGSAWERIGNSNRFYFHSFAKEQPDFDWENAALRDEICTMMNYWQDKGVAGFRVDAIGNLKKSDQALSRTRFEPDGEDGLTSLAPYVLMQDGIQDYLKEMRDRVFKPHDSFTVAEVSVPEHKLLEFIGPDGYFSTVFDFSYTDIDVEERGGATWKRPWTFREMKEKIILSQMDVQKYGFASPYLENHDQPRSVSKYIPSRDRSYESVTALATMYFFLRGVPFIFQGQELGMENCPFRSIEDFRDPVALQRYAQALERGEDPEAVFAYLRERGRDHGRTPMQWDSTENAGFSEGTPWIMVNPGYVQCNALSQMREGHSIYHYYKDMITLRKKEAYASVLETGWFVPVESRDDRLFCYRRENDSQSVRVLINFSADYVRVPENLMTGEVLLSNREASENGRLMPYHAIVFSE